MRELDVLWASAISERARNRKGKRRERRREKGKQDRSSRVFPVFVAEPPRTRSNKAKSQSPTRGQKPKPAKPKPTPPTNTLRAASQVPRTDDAV